jgi:hypothetical protein
MKRTEGKTISLKPCRDCGAMVSSTARGCPVCARNLEAERILARYFWLIVVPAILILSVAVAALLYSRR